MTPKTLDEGLPLFNEPGRLPYSKDNARKVLGSVKKCSKPYLYNCPLSMIPVDAAAFVKRWQSHMDRKENPKDFTSFTSFQTWHSNVKSFMEHVSGVSKARALLRQKTDGWTVIEATMTDMVRPGRSGSGIRTSDILEMTVLRNTARENGKEPWQISTRMVTGWLGSCTAAQIAAFGGAFQSLNKLHAHPEFTQKELLPALLDPLPTTDKRRKSQAMTPRFREAVEAYLGDMATGQPMNGLLKSAKRKPVQPSTLKAERDGLNWFWSCLLELDFADPDEDPDPKGFASISIVDAVFGAESDGSFRWKTLTPRTVRKNLGIVFRFLQSLDRTILLYRKEFFEADYFQSIEAMSAANQAFCKRLVESPQRSWTFMNMAMLLQKEAAAMMAIFDSLSETQKAQACHLALAAAAAAVLTFLPLRAGTLTALDIFGDMDKTHVFLPEHKPVVTFVIPPHLIKNDISIDATIEKRGKTDPRKILDWWMSEAREKVMERIGNPQPERLLGGTTYNHLRRAWIYGTAHLGTYMNLHQVRHATASILINQPHPDVEMIAALLGDMPATVIQSYAFFSRKQAMQRGQVGMQNVNKALARQVGNMGVAA